MICGQVREQANGNGNPLLCHKKLRTQYGYRTDLVEHFGKLTF